MRKLITKVKVWWHELPPYQKWEVERNITIAVAFAAFILMLFFIDWLLAGWVGTGGVQ